MWGVLPPALSLENHSWGFLGEGFWLSSSLCSWNCCNRWFFPWCALGDARQRVPCAPAFLTRSTIVRMGLLLRAADSGGLGPALAAKGITASGQNMCVVAEAIEQRGSELLVAEHLDPLGERQVGGDDGRAALVALGQQIEQQLAASALKWNEAEFVHD